MSAITHNYRLNVLRVIFAKKRDALIDRLVPRRSMVISVGMIVAGIGIPTLMLFQLLPASLLLGFTGVALIAVGGVLTLFYCGEI